MSGNSPRSARSIVELATRAKSANALCFKPFRIRTHRIKKPTDSGGGATIWPASGSGANMGDLLSCPNDILPDSVKADWKILHSSRCLRSQVYVIDCPLYDRPLKTLENCQPVTPAKLGEQRAMVAAAGGVFGPFDVWEF
jgi:hypothetical protein